ncbi:MAG TPA: IS256 family transposase [Candidatus Baltobacteraceae bacterium]|nr:IS256 family transposase [Candidatus Baltobacteraceae bacterium]
MKRSYRTQAHSAKRNAAELQAHLEDVCRAKVSEVFQAVLEAEVDDALERLRYERRSDVERAGYRDGHDRARTIASNRGPITIARPRVRGARFTSSVLPKHRRKLESVDRSLTDLWLDGLATRDFEGTLRAFLGANAPLSAATITRANQRLCKDFDAWNARRLNELELVFAWADGVYLGAGPDDERRVFLVVLGADRLGVKHLLAIREAMSESETAWAELFADLAARGLHAPALMIADGAHGLWAAVQKAWPGVAEQRCWLHKIRNVEEKLPTKHQAAARKALSEIMHAEREPEARRKLEQLAKSYERSYPKAASCLRDDVDRLFAYYRFPHACWIHLRTTNPIESIFSPIRNRTDAMKRLRTGKFAAAITLALIEKLSKNWRRLRGYRDLYEVAAEPIALKRAA